MLTTLHQPPSIDPSTDTLVPIAETVKKRTGKRLAPATGWRWVRKGVNGVRLPAVKIGPTWYTTEEGWRWFVEQQTEAALPSGDDTRHTERTERTKKRLEAAGLVE